MQVKAEYRTKKKKKKKEKEITSGTKEPSHLTRNSSSHRLRKFRWVNPLLNLSPSVISAIFFQWRDNDENGTAAQGKEKDLLCLSIGAEVCRWSIATDSLMIRGTAGEKCSGGGFKETAVMLRRQLEEKGFSTMRECV